MVVGASADFDATVTWSDGSDSVPSMTFTANGGATVDAESGAYTAPDTPGTYRVIIAVENSDLRDTATVTVNAAPVPGQNSLFYNSAEQVCAATNPAILFCDDFEDGDWYIKNSDDAAASGGLLQTDGWRGSIFASISPAGAAVCGSRGAEGTNCAATSGPLSGSAAGRNMAKHGFAGGPVTEMWARWYYRADDGYQWGAEKSMNFTKSAGDITWFNLQFNCGTGSRRTTATPHIQIIHGPSHACYSPNVSSITLEDDRWYYFEVHVKLNSSGTVADGLIEMYINDCGTSGQCSGSPTLRTRLEGVAFDRNQSGCEDSPCRIEILWLENWANPGSIGSSYYDQIVASKAGPIGFMP